MRMIVLLTSPMLRRGACGNRIKRVQDTAIRQRPLGWQC
jgi:hypothetical protein